MFVFKKAMLWLVAFILTPAILSAAKKEKPVADIPSSFPEWKWQLEDKDSPIKEVQSLKVSVLGRDSSVIDYNLEVFVSSDKDLSQGNILRGPVQRMLVGLNDLIEVEVDADLSKGDKIHFLSTPSAKWLERKSKDIWRYQRVKYYTYHVFGEAKILGPATVKAGKNRYQALVTKSFYPVKVGVDQVRVGPVKEFQLGDAKNEINGVSGKVISIHGTLELSLTYGLVYIHTDESVDEKSILSIYEKGQNTPKAGVQILYSTPAKGFGSGQVLTGIVIWASSSVRPGDIVQ